ncbi:MAG: hypothetical protein QOH42_1802 [Blastocatellia bacterium]|nr:hypothetical protein [Blastocatellia bacterium]MDX6306251.1 hypothetical protein [Blastocatellia bacterium]
MNYWAVSDLNGVELHEFARLVKSRNCIGLGNDDAGFVSRCRLEQL